MKFGSVAVAYKEERFITPHLNHLPEWIDQKVVLNSTKPWFGEEEELDDTSYLASEAGAVVVNNYWLNEHQQRNTGQDIHQNKDWVIVLDPDEFLDNADWVKLKSFLENTQADAVVAQSQRVFWKDKEVSPHTDYQQLIAVRPDVRFVDKRVVGTGYVEAPVTVLHFSWARTDDECWRKISHYAHAHDFDTEEWFGRVWRGGKTTNLHPVSPETLKALIDPKLPPEIEELGLWP